MDELAAPPKNPLALSGAQRRVLRALGHHLKPVVQVGRSGVTESLVEATAAALQQHELVKVSVSRESPLDRDEVAAQLGDATGAHVAQVLGRTVLVYRRRFKDPVIELPGPFEEAPRPAPEPSKR